MLKVTLANIKVKDVDAFENLTKDEQLQKMTEYILRKIPKIARGDVVGVNELVGERNNGVFMWDGTAVIPLYTGADDYGSVPCEIEIADDNNFDAKSWKDLIYHNDYVWYSPKIRQRMNFKTVDGESKAVVTIRGTVWTFVSDDSPAALKKALPANNCVFSSEYNDTNNIVHVEITKKKPKVVKETKQKPKAPPPCSIRNPATGKYVLMDGPTGKKLLKAAGLL